VEGCGTRSPKGIRQNRVHEIESATSRHSVSWPNRYRCLRNTIRKYLSSGIDGRPHSGENEIMVGNPAR
jgi:hypothetical protein